MKLNDKKVVITGTSSGIGCELLSMLQQEGCRIVAADLHECGPEDALEGVEYFTGDLSNSETINRLFDFALDRMGDIDIFIANAGFAYYEELQRADWGHIERIFSVNTFAPFYAALKMKELKGEQPFNFMVTASAMGIYSLPGYALYSSTKAAVRSFAEAYRYQLEKGQRFQVVYPIATKTHFFEEAGGSPVPFPSQTTDTVVRAMVKGLKSGRNSIFPAWSFLVTMFLNTFLPVMNIYRSIENKKLQRWLAEKD